MSPRVLRVALTGGIATGKSYCLQRFSAMGVPCIDADQLAREAVAPGSPGLEAIVARFGRTVLDADGHLDRKVLGRLVFGDPNARRDLEAIVHPGVYTAIQGWFGGIDADPAGAPGFAVADVPLLYETGRADRFDRVVVAACGPEQQLERLRARDGLNETEALARIRAQLPIEDKRRRADFVIDTSGSPAETDRQIDVVCGLLTQAADDVESTK